jgi:hypothetical protein
MEAWQGMSWLPISFLVIQHMKNSVMAMSRPPPLFSVSYCYTLPTGLALSRKPATLHHMWHPEVPKIMTLITNIPTHV